jgi:hypothetical protein
MMIKISYDFGNKKWSGWRDLNARLLRPERSALPSWATSRHGHGRYIIYLQMSTVFYLRACE